MIIINIAHVWHHWHIFGIIRIGIKQCYWRFYFLSLSRFRVNAFYKNQSQTSVVEQRFGVNAFYKNQSQTSSRSRQQRFRVNAFGKLVSVRDHHQRCTCLASLHIFGIIRIGVNAFGGTTIWRKCILQKPVSDEFTFTTTTISRKCIWKISLLSGDLLFSYNIYFHHHQWNRNLYTGQITACDRRPYYSFLTGQ